MLKSAALMNKMRDSHLVALLSPKSIQDCVNAYEITEAEGIVLEIALRSAPALEGIAAISAKYPEALVLAGTVMSGEQAELAIQAGAAGIVSADYLPEVVEVCVSYDIMCVPGGLADAGKQLAYKAALYGCSLSELRTDHPFQWIYKLFPAFSGEQTHIALAKAWRGPFPGLTVLYTGGLSLDSVRLAAVSDPGGIFCASALSRNLAHPDRMQQDIQCWIQALQPGFSVKEQDPPWLEPLHKTSARIVTFGELMLRLSPDLGQRLRDSRRLDAGFGGAEANVAVSLAGFGLSASFVSALPANDMGKNANQHLRSANVDTSSILFQGPRLGIYYLEHGSGVRPSKVIYDRANSSLALVSGNEFDWPGILGGATWFHWTGITPALGEGPRKALRYALETAKSLGITISVDLNFRKKLWTGDLARQVMQELMPYVDVCIGNEEDATRIFGIQPGGTDVDSGKLDIDGYRQLALELQERFGFAKVAVTLRESLSASENRWSACLFDGQNFLMSSKYSVPIIDRVGSGDAFAAGLIYSIIQGKTNRRALEFAVAAAVWKHSLHGDFNQADAEEIEMLAAGSKSGRIQR